jgi:gluconolactonase
MARGARRNLDVAFDGKKLVGVNDIQPDPAGGLYFGCNDFAAIGGPAPVKPDCLYRRDPSGAVAKIAEGVELSNGIGLSPDGARLYHVDTFQGVFVSDISADGGIADRRLLIDRRGGDGVQIDAEGGIWVAGYGTADLTRYHPDGSVDRRIDFSGKFDGCCVTSLAFGGPDLRDLYVVTAGDYRRPAKGQGRIYRARSDVPGQKTPLVQNPLLQSPRPNGERVG